MKIYIHTHTYKCLYYMYILYTHVQYITFTVFGSCPQPETAISDLHGFTIWFAYSLLGLLPGSAPNTFAHMYILCLYLSDMMYITYTMQLYVCNLLQCRNSHDVSDACDDGIHSQHVSEHACCGCVMPNKTCI